MPLTTLDTRSALVVIDLQRGIVASPKAHPTDAVVRNASRLAQAFRQQGLPVVLVNVTGGAPGRPEQAAALGQLPADWADLVPELGQQPQDHVVSKRTWGAFTGTDLRDYLRQHGVTQIVLAGISTSIGVESTARQAHELGLNVTLTLDAMTDTHLDAHQHSVTRIFPRLGETGSTEDVLALLASRTAA
jgi:nicotinamidase-related amidase